MMYRMNVYLTEKLNQKLEEIKKLTGAPKAETIRRALVSYFYFLDTNKCIVCGSSTNLSQVSCGVTLCLNCRSEGSELPPCSECNGIMAGCKFSK